MTTSSERKYIAQIDKLNEKSVCLTIEECWDLFCRVYDASFNLVSTENKLACIALLMNQFQIARILLQKNAAEILSVQVKDRKQFFSIVIWAILEKNPHAVIQYMLYKQGAFGSIDTLPRSNGHAAKDVFISISQAQQLKWPEQKTDLLIGSFDVVSILEQRALHRGNDYTVAEVFTANENGQRVKKVGVLFCSGRVRWDKDCSYSEPSAVPSQTALH